MLRQRVYERIKELRRILDTEGPMEDRAASFKVFVRALRWSDLSILFVALWLKLLHLGDDAFSAFFGSSDDEDE